MRHPNNDAVEQAKICQAYPFLTDWSPVKIPWREQFRQVIYDPVKPLVRPILKKLRETPRVFVSMPFDFPEPAVAFHFVVRPLIEDVFGGRCVRYNRTGVTESEWKQAVMIEMLQSHLVIFDRSYPSVNVAYEAGWFELLSGTSKGKKHLRKLCIFYRQLGQERRPEPFCIPYACDGRWWLKNFADDLRSSITDKLVEIGFREGKFDPWVLYENEHLYSATH